MHYFLSVPDLLTVFDRCDREYGENLFITDRGGACALGENRGGQCVKMDRCAISNVLKKFETAFISKE